MRCCRKILATKMHAQIAFSCGGFRLRFIPDAPLALIWGRAHVQCHLDCPARRKWNRAKTRNQARPRVPAKKMGCPVRPFVAIGQTVPLFFWYLDTDTPEDLYIFHFWVASSSCHGSRSSGFWQRPLCPKGGCFSPTFSGSRGSTEDECRIGRHQWCGDQGRDGTDG